MAEIPNSDRPYGLSPSMPERSPTQQDNRKKRKNRREYALPKFEFESNILQQQGTSGVLATYGLTTDDSLDRSTNLQERVERYYGDQVLVPHGSVSPCINATDRARRARRNHIREPGADMPSAQASISEAGTFCDITRLLQELTRPKCVAQAPKHNGKGEYTDDEILVENDIPDMVLSEDDDDPGDEFEIVKYEPMSEHNGTVRRWYRGFRH